jgi:hypothetical protein
MKNYTIILFILILTSPISACMIDQLVGETNNGVSWPTEGPKWGQSFVACEDGEVWEIAVWPHLITTGIHTLILTDINCVTMWTVNNIDLSTSGGNPVTIDLATGSGTSRSVTSGTSYIFQLIGPAGSNLQMWLSWVDPYPAGEDKAANCGSYALDWWFRLSIDEPLSPLPIKLSSFDATVLDQGTAVELNFETASEIGASHFEIENSTDGKTFKKLGIVEATGTSNISQSYKFMHQHPHSGINYYRLKQVDEDESYEYSGIVQVHMKSQEVGHRIFPNPTQGDIEVYFDQSPDAEITFYLFNLNGEVLATKPLTPGDSKISMEGSIIPAGIYVLKAIENGQLLWIDKVVKQ